MSLPKPVTRKEFYLNRMANGEDSGLPEPITREETYLKEIAESQDGEVSVAWGDVTGKPSTFPPTIGTTATTAKAGNYQPTWAQVTGKPSTFAPAAHNQAVSTITGLQAIIDDLTSRIEALEA